MKSIAVNILWVLFSIFVLFAGTQLFTPKSFAATTGTWTLLGLSDRVISAITVDPTDKDIIYAGSQDFGDGDGTSVFKSTDGGANWTEVGNGLPGTETSGNNFWAIAVSPSNHNVVYAGAQLGAFKSTDGGANWTNITPTDPNTVDIEDIAIDPTDSNNVYITSNNGLYKSTDGGANWTQQMGGNPLNVELDPENPSTVYLVAGGNGFWKSTDGGANWTQTFQCGSSCVHSISIDAVNRNLIYTASSGTSSNSIVYKSTDGALNWSTTNGPNTVIDPREYISDPIRQNTLIVGGNYNFNTQRSDAFISFDQGTTWNTIGDGWTDGVTFTRFRTVYRPTNDADVLYAGRESGADNNDSGIWVYGLPHVNSSPIVGPITAPSMQAVNTSLTATASFTDADTSNTHTATWNWGDGNTTTGSVTESSGSGSVSNSHTYTSTGVYTITLTVTDNNGGSGTSTFNYVSVYASNSSFVGGNKFANPSSASPNTTGDVKFGISTKYDNSNQLVGNVKMNFKNADIDFVSTALSALTTSNGKAYLTGSGTYNGTGGYTFLATGIDSTVAGGTDRIRFRIKDSANNVVYDSQPGAGDTTDPTTTVSHGSIRVD
jgi:hypothetical protein